MRATSHRSQACPSCRESAPVTTAAADLAESMKLLSAALTSGSGLHAGYLWKHEGNASVADVIAEVYYINVGSARERRQNMESQLEQFQKRNSVRYARFKAVTPSDQRVQEFAASTSFQKMMHHHHHDHHQKIGSKAKIGSNNRQKSYLRKQLKVQLIGSKACGLSHFDLWRLLLKDSDALLSEAPFALVLEDDAVLSADALDALPERLRDIPEEADMILLGFWGSKRPEDEVAAGIYKAQLPFHFLNGTEDQFFYGGSHAYLLRLDSLPRMIAFVGRGLSIYPDEVTAYSSVPGSVRKYVLYPPLVHLKLGERKSLHPGLEDRIMEADPDMVPTS
ncbi:unnamed protein product [Polarella glacialis]|uniref:Glycosyl transferase family 25 domain-containing protein n=1 Tax=Polarella glacialis TaxID=89957 RepID=A0A813HEA3_POLGL|nr:unnamed protein product [Polarella glacialis]CAE8652807.1 unnamed protein product [Polarella glacialis]